jgi:hypothetical protein
VRVGAEVAERQVHAVAVVAWKGERAIVEHPHEAGIAALVGALRSALGVSGRQEEHVHTLDERALLGADGGAHQALVDAIGEPARVEPVLEVPRVRVVCGRLAHAQKPSRFSNVAFSSTGMRCSSRDTGAARISLI